MSMFELHSCLARLYTDDVFRDLLTIAPQAALNRYELTQDEIEVVLSIDKADLALFAQSIINTYSAHCRSAFPLSFRLQRSLSYRIFARYFSIHKPFPSEPISRFVLNFGGFLVENFNVDLVTQPFFRDIINYEIAQYEIDIQETRNVDSLKLLPHFASCSRFDLTPVWRTPKMSVRLSVRSERWDTRSTPRNSSARCWRWRRQESGASPSLSANWTSHRG